ncbi:MAG: carbon-nitrogen hydrolase [Chloroflexi bacterium]|nr:carbon-nitrogen hydrolase [Chloroflexota bacterium]
MRDFRVGVAQMNPALGDLDRNLGLHLEWIERARRDGCDLVVFPELSLTGYVLEDLAYGVGMRLDDPRLAVLIEQSKSISIIVGFVEHTPDHQYRIASAYLEDGEIRYVHHKVYLVTYGLFDEGRYLAAGERVRAFDTKFGRQAILICEDLWHPSALVIAAADGADVIHAPAASPGRGISGAAEVLGSARTWHDLTRVYAQMLVNFTVFANRTGYEDGINFYGASRILAPDGQVLADAGGDPALISADLSDGALRRARIASPLRRDEKLDVTLNELARIRQARIR